MIDGIPVFDCVIHVYDMSDLEPSGGRAHVRARAGTLSCPEHDIAASAGQ